MTMDFKHKLKAEVVYDSDGKTNILLKISYKTFIEDWKQQRQLSPETTYTDLLNRSLPETDYRIVDSNSRLEKVLGGIYSLVLCRLRKTRGGRQQDEIKSKVYQFQVEPNELSYRKLCSQCDIYDVQKMNRQCENLSCELEKKSSQCESLASSLKEINIQCESLSKDVEKLKVENKNLHEYISNMTDFDPNIANFRLKAKVGKRQEQRRMKSLTQHTDQALWFLKSFGLEAEYVKFKGKDKVFRVESKDEDEDEHDDEQIKSVLHLLDRFGVSDAFYHELTTLEAGLPRSYLIKQCRQNLNSMMTIHRTPGIDQGVQVSLFEELERLLSEDKENLNSITVKVSGDGAPVSKKNNFTTISFSVIHDGDDSVPEVHPLAIIRAAESYEMLKVSCRDVFRDINKLNEDKHIVAEGRMIEVNVCLSADYKFLLLVMGLAGANSAHACLFCNVHKDNRHDVTKPIGYYEDPDRKRTVHKIEQSAAAKTLSVKEKPLLKISIENIVIDELHLLLRITDKLTTNMVHLMLEQDKRKEFKKQMSCDTFVNRFQKAVCSTGVVFRIYEKMNADGSGSGQYDYTTLTGNDKKKVLSKLPDSFQEFILDQEIANSIAELWRNFEKLFSMVAQGSDAEVYFKEAVEWMKQYLELGGRAPGFERRSVTPYMHIMIYHVPQMIKEHGCLKKFSGQLVAKTNDKLRKAHLLKSSNYDSCYEAMTSVKRQQQLRHLSREVRVYTCTATSPVPRKKPKTIGVEIREDTQAMLRRRSEIESYSSAEIKARLQGLGVTTRIRNYRKLVELLLEHQDS